MASPYRSRCLKKPSHKRGGHITRPKEQGCTCGTLVLSVPKKKRNCLGTRCFCAKMPFLRLPLVKFSHVAVLHIENFTFGIHKNAYFIPKNRST